MTGPYADIDAIGTGIAGCSADYSTGNGSGKSLVMQRKNPRPERLRSQNTFAAAIDAGSVGAIYAKLQRMIMQYYENVQNQTKASFNIAK